MARPVGSQNKLGAQAKNAVWEAHRRLGGLEHLIQFGRDNPEAFYKIWAKLIPNDARIELAVSHTITRNFTGKASLESDSQAEALPVIDGEATVVGVGMGIPHAMEECEIDRSYKPEGEDDVDTD